MILNTFLCHVKWMENCVSWVDHLPIVMYAQLHAPGSAFQCCVQKCEWNWYHKSCDKNVTMT